MRITTKVIQNNSLSNINANKVLQDKLSNQMSTQKKINRPSDDPVVAIRALRLRTNVSQVTQYYEKNVPDAKSWLEITEDALTSVSEVVTSMIEQCQKGSSEKLTDSDRQVILDEIKALRDEVYATGNADYAGRSVFTGYRTDTTLKFTKAETKQYSITQQLESDSVDTIKYIDTAGLGKITDVNFDSTPQADIEEADVKEYSIHRIRLAYSNIDGTPANNPVIQSVDGTIKIEPDIVSENDDPSPYISIDPDKCYLIKETGEILLGDNVYTAIMNLKDDAITSDVNEGELRITYEKSTWDTDDLRPEHYFACTDMSDADPANWVAYNGDYLTDTSREKQAIEYDVGMNQTIRVNTTADEVFTHDIGRDVDDLIKVMEECEEIAQTLSELKKLAGANASDPTKSAVLKTQIEAAEKAQTLVNEKRQKLFEGAITKMQGHLDTVNYATTSCGTRSKKLELIENRLMSQKTSFETLQSENENVDITEVAIQLSGAETAYSAALMATGKILQTSLVDYI